MRKYHLLWILILIAPFFGIAGEPELKFSHLNTESGISSNVIYSIYKDSKGYMWFGSEDGLNMYDGYESRVFLDISSDSTSLSGNIIFHIWEDKKKNLWVTTNTGANIFNRDLMNFKHIKLIDADGTERYRDYCQWLNTDTSGNIFLTIDNWTYCYDTGKEVFNEFVINDEVYSKFKNEYKEVAFIDSRNRLWMASRAYNETVFCYDLDRKKIIVDPFGPAFLGIKDKIYTIEEQSNGDIWLGTNNGIYVVSPDMSGYYKISVEKGIINAILFDGKDKVWIAHDSDGLLLYLISQKKIIAYRNNEFDPWSISSNKVLSVFRDNEGIIWAGTTQGGVNYAELSAGKAFRNLFKDLKNTNSLAYNTVSVIFQDRDGDIWIGTDGGGVDCYTVAKDKFTHYSHEPIIQILSRVILLWQSPRHLMAKYGLVVTLPVSALLIKRLAKYRQ
jgi:ligand-binding sensor domain-containing protein